MNWKPVENSKDDVVCLSAHEQLYSEWASDDRQTTDPDKRS